MASQPPQGVALVWLHGRSRLELIVFFFFAQLTPNPLVNYHNICEHSGGILESKAVFFKMCRHVETLA